MTALAKFFMILVLVSVARCHGQKRLSLREYLPTQLQLLETIAQRLDSIDNSLQKIQAAVEVNDNETVEDAVESRRELAIEKIQFRQGVPPVWRPAQPVPSARDSAEKQQIQAIPGTDPLRRRQNSIDSDTSVYHRQFDLDFPQNRTDS